MKTSLLRGLLTASCLLLDPALSIATESPLVQKKNTYVIVHGAFGGGWDWKNVAQLLSADGNVVYRPTLTGLGERVHLAHPSIGLSTHVNDVVNVILYEDLHDVVLVGHSYAGMVITGVIDRVPERIQHVIYLDAFVPENGESANDGWQLTGVPPWRADGTDELRELGPILKMKASRGFISLTTIDPHTSPPVEAPQPMRTWTEPVAFQNPAARRLRGSAVWFIEPEDQRALVPGYWFEIYGHRVEARGWKNYYLVSDHLAERTHPGELAKLLGEIVQNAAGPGPAAQP